MKKLLTAVLLIAAATLLMSSANQTQPEPEWYHWLTGVWVSGDGTFTVYSDHHYFVISAEGDTAKPNVYCGGSQIILHPKGIARAQRIRVRQAPDGPVLAWRPASIQLGGVEPVLTIDTALFIPGSCTNKNGVLYDAVMELTDDQVILSTCNGDRIKIYRDGRYGYLPADGGEYLSYKVEQL